VIRADWSMGDVVIAIGNSERTAAALMIIAR
jgi:hypothetical protein